MKKLALFLILCPLLAFAQTPSEAVTVRASADKRVITIGDRIRYTISVDYGKDIEFVPPELAASSDFSLRDYSSAGSPILKPRSRTYEYILTTYTTGVLTLPKASVKYKEKNARDWSNAESNEVKIEVKSLISDTVSDIQDIKGPVHRIRWIILCIVVLILILAGAVIFWRHRRKKPQEMALQKSACEIALERLRSLKNRDLPGRGKLKEYYSELSDIIRRYLEDRFDIRAPEMTTEEFLLSIKRRQEVNTAQKQLLEDFLTSADMVKFARYGPSADEIEKNFAAAVRFVEETADTPQTQKEQDTQCR